MGNNIMRETLPVVALRGLTIMPDMIIHFDLSREKSIASVQHAMMADQRLFVVAQKNADVEDPGEDDLFQVGTIVAVKQITKLPNNIVRVLVEGLERAKIENFMDGEYLSADLELLDRKSEAGTAQSGSENDGAQSSSVESNGAQSNGAQSNDAESNSAEDSSVGNSRTENSSAENSGARNSSAEDKDVEKDRERANIEEAAMVRGLQELFAEYISCHPKMGGSIARHFREMENLEELINQLMISIPISQLDRQRVLEIIDKQDQYVYLCQLIERENAISQARKELSEKIKGRVEKNQKEYLLREQMNYIREELGDGGLNDADQFEEDCEKLKASGEVKNKIKKEIRRFRTLSSSSSESAVERNYIETLLELPWDKMSKDCTDIDKAEQVLNEAHYGLEQVKERILEFLSVRALTKQGDSPIICLIGPPGTGKTSIAESVAKALHKKYVRISLGGVRDENEIRGHRKTYVGAMPGRIVAGLRQAGVKNPLMLLDEIDKVSGDSSRGDTSAALLEVLDAGQNSHFRDHYVEVPIDLSEVLFIATANSASTIPRPLLDRMELIEVSSYTANEKFHIAKEHLVKRQIEKNGLKPEQIQISDNALKELISGYTREAGVRGLDRRLGQLCRKAAREILQKKKAKVTFSANRLEKYLGKPRYRQDHINKTDEIGIVRGLAWTSVGGDTLQIEVNKMPGKGKIELTGQMGDVMKESAMAGFSYIRSIGAQYDLAPEVFSEHDFHIHIPEGAVPKDGPSAGITMATAMLSVVTGTPVRADVAMTGEITLRGRVLPIGGLKEKMLAAKMAGIRTILVPKDNEKDVEEIEKEIKDGLEIKLVETMQEVIETAFVSTKESQI